MNGAYEECVKNVPFYGFATLCIAHPVVQAMIPRISDRRIVTYGMSPQADVRAIGIEMGTGGAVYDVVITSRADDRSRTIERLALPMHAAHNVQNSPAAIPVATEMGIDDDAIPR